MKFSWHKDQVPDNIMQEKFFTGATVPLAVIIFILETKDLRDFGHNIQLSSLWAVWFQKNEWKRNTTVASLSKKAQYNRLSAQPLIIYILAMWSWASCIIPSSSVPSFCRMELINTICWENKLRSHIVNKYHHCCQHHHH